MVDKAIPRTRSGSEKITTLIAVCALLVSAVSLMYTARTYYVSHRPYLGIVETPFGIVGDPPYGFTWKIVIKNVGNVPAMFRVDEISSVVGTMEGRPEAALPGGPSKTGFLLMPGQINELNGNYDASGGRSLVPEVLSGAVPLNISVKLSYEMPSPLFWKDHWYYHAVLRLQPRTGLPPAFSTISASAN